jgi:hypothetical protein
VRPFYSEHRLSRCVGQDGRVGTGTRASYDRLLCCRRFHSVGCLQHRLEHLVLSAGGFARMAAMRLCTKSDQSRRNYTSKCSLFARYQLQMPRRRCDRNVKKSGAGVIPYRYSVARFGKAGLLSSDAVGNERSVAFSFFFGRTLMTPKIAGRKFSGKVKEEPFHATTTRRRPYRSK